MKTLNIFILLLLPFFAFSQPQINDKKHHKKIHAEKIKFLKNNLQLTKNEESKFLPLYNEFSEKRKNLHTERRRIMKNFKKNSLNLSESQISEMGDNCIEIESKLLELSKEYHTKFKKVLSPVKILILYRSEHQFKRHLLKRMKKSHCKIKTDSQ